MGVGLMCGGMEGHGGWGIWAWPNQMLSSYVGEWKLMVRGIWA